MHAPPHVSARNLDKYASFCVLQCTRIEANKTSKFGAGSFLYSENMDAQNSYQFAVVR